MPVVSYLIHTHTPSCSRIDTNLNSYANVHFFLFVTKFNKYSIFYKIEFSASSSGFKGLNKIQSHLMMVSLTMSSNTVLFKGYRSLWFTSIFISAFLFLLPVQQIYERHSHLHCNTQPY